ncbi:MAG: Na+/H+ antiporter subunit E [Nannocystaceae bacterium]
MSVPVPGRGAAVPRRKWLGHPGLSVVIFATWLLANDSLDPGHIILAVLFALVLPRMTAEFWEDAPRIHRPGVALRLFMVFAYDVVIANFRVAVLVLGPNSRLRPAFIEVPLDLEDSFGVAVLATMITLTPGTLSAHMRERDQLLVVHVLDVDDGDEAALVAEIKQRYERPLREVLGC